MNNLYSLTRLFVAAVTTNICMLIIITRFYAGSFSLLLDPFSWLGALVTESGLRNNTAAFMFTATQLCNVVFWRRARTLLLEFRTGRHPLVRFLGGLVQAGFILMAFPCDRFVFIHSLGAGFTVGGLWALTSGLLYNVRERLGRGTHILMQFLLQLSAVYCGVNFVLDSPLKGFSQRPLLIAFIAETGLCLKMLLRAQAGRRAAWHQTEAY